VTDTKLLLRACREHPAEDTPRLMLADALQTDGFDGAAAYIRESIEFARRSGKKRRVTRSAMGRDYIRWLGQLLSLPVCDSYAEYKESNFICAGETWDDFYWRAAPFGGNRWCDLYIERGLPTRLAGTLPLVMERAADLFQFPIQDVAARDRRPEYDEMFRVYQWVCSLYPQTWNTWEETPYNVPKPIYSLIEWPTVNGHVRRDWSKKQDATDALHAAILKFGHNSVR
jgi:uncharacterized protein (TIGR02996 family)